MTTRVDLARALITQQARLEARLRELGEPVPSKEPWDDEVTYTNSLLEAVEVAEESKRMNRAPLTILVFKMNNGQWAYAPKASMADPRMARVFRFADEPGFPSLADALNAIRRDRSIPNDHDIEVEEDAPSALAFFRGQGGAS